MAKIKWGVGSGEALTAADVDSADVGFTPYAGDIPPAGVYRFTLKRSKFTTFESSGNQGLTNLFELDGSWKAEHRKYDGCPMWDRVTFTKAAAGFVKAFAEALGVSSRDILNNVITDDEQLVTKIGAKKIADQDLVFYINVKRGRQTSEDPWRLERQGAGYLPLREDADDEADDEADGDGQEPSMPVGREAEEGKAKKVKAGSKAKKGKAAAEDEPPF